MAKEAKEPKATKASVKDALSQCREILTEACKGADDDKAKNIAESIIARIASL